MKENELKITLLVSTYNWKEALKCSLMSAFRQTLLPMEIVIADDGSDEQTRNLIEEMRQISPVPLVHVWHEDKGFRKCEISNKAIAKSQGDYIVQIDGDVILERHFIEDHAALAEKGYFVCGSRVHLDSRTSNLILSGKIRIPRIFHLPIGYFLNSLREAHLRNFFAKRYGRKLDHMRGCNMAFWKDNFIQVNGYNEDSKGSYFKPDSAKRPSILHWGACGIKFTFDASSFWGWHGNGRDGAMLLFVAGNVRIFNFLTEMYRYAPITKPYFGRVYKGYALNSNKMPCGGVTTK